MLAHGDSRRVLEMLADLLDANGAAQKLSHGLPVLPVGPLHDHLQNLTVVVHNEASGLPVTPLDPDLLGLGVRRADIDNRRGPFDCGLLALSFPYLTSNLARTIMA